jgi:type I restriction enzyme S subunit
MCITIAANIAETGILTYPACFPDSVVGFIAEPKNAHVQFVEYMFRFMRSRIQHQATGSVQDNINIETLERLRFPVPPLAEQRAIASVLGALDDKIELNRRMNATLEAMARALFQSWFVDFDPVRAKQEGRKPTGMDDATAALFPEDFENSAIGHIPLGWRVRTIESVSSTVTRGVTPEYGEGTGRFIINQRVNRGCDLDWSSLKELSHGLEVPPERFAKRWDVLVNCLGEGTLGRTHLYKWESDIYAVDQHMSICRAEHPSGGAYIYQVLSGTDGQAKIESLKTGSTGMTMLNISKLRTFELVWPSAEILAAYFRTVEPLWLKIANNDKQSRTLATLRDTLLPKLLSGELRVPDAEQAIAAE